MWESIAQILTGPNALAVLVVLVVIILVLVILVKAGVLRVSTPNVQLGASTDIERNIIRQQLDYVRLHLDGLESTIMKPKGYTEYLGKYILSEVYAEYVDWITFNHINKSPAYVSLKQERLVNLIRRYTVKEEFRNEEFDNFIREDTKKVLEDLIKIREVYK